MKKASPANFGGDTLAVVILAAGQGKRMQSALPKPLHKVAGVPMVQLVARAAEAAEPSTLVVVVPPKGQEIAGAVNVSVPVTAVEQHIPRGTGDAVRQALGAAGDVRWLMVLFGDHPLLTAEVVRAFMAEARASRALVTLLSCQVSNPAGYARVARDRAGRPVAIVEKSEDDPRNRAGELEINSGLMVLDAEWARGALLQLTPSAKTGELYLTELVALAIRDRGQDSANWPVAVVDAPLVVAQGVNDRRELAEADRVARARILDDLAERGVTVVIPAATAIDAEVTIGADTTIHPFSVIRARTTIGADCVIGPQAILERATLEDRVTVWASTVRDSTIRTGSDVGPYSYVRGGAVIGPHVHVGCTAEIKNAVIHEGTMVGHFSYLGDAEIGPGTNIGAGTITANFDGVNKHRTEIGSGAFIGSDTILRAPVRIGDGATIGAGSVVTRDVPELATAVGVPARVIKRRAPGEDGKQQTENRFGTEEGSR